VNATTYKLYGRAGTGSDIVRMLLEEAGAPYEFITVGSEPADIEAYRTLTPTDKVPALALPQGGAMFESAAICIHLAAAHPGARLSANLYECARRIYYGNRYSREGERAAEGIRQQAVIDFAAILSVIVPALSPYVLGKEFSAADYYLYVVGGWHPDGWTALHARWPSLARHTALVAARPVVRIVEAQQRA